MIFNFDYIIKKDAAGFTGGLLKNFFKFRGITYLILSSRVRATGHWVLGIRYWMLDVEYWALDVGHWALGVRYWALGVGPLKARRFIRT